MNLLDSINKSLNDLNLNPFNHDFLINWLDAITDEKQWGWYKPKYAELIEFFQSINEKAQSGEPVAQHALGFLYELGINEEWIAAIAKKSDLDSLRDKLVKEDKEYNEILPSSKKNQGKKWKSTFSKLAVKKSNEKSKYEKLLERRRQLLGEQRQHELDVANHLIFSEETYRSKKTVEPTKAFYWYEQAVLNGNKDACFNLGICYLTGFGIAQDEQKGLNLIFEAAGSDNTDACRLLGRAYLVTKNQQEKMKAYSYISKALNKDKSLLLGLHFILKEKLYYDIDIAGANGANYAENKVKKGLDSFYNEIRKVQHEAAVFYLKNGVIGDVPDVLNKALNKYQSIIMGSIELDKALKLFGENSEINNKKYTPICFDESLWIKRSIAGLCYKGIPENYAKGTSPIAANQEKALEIWHDLAHENDPIACYRLAMHYKKANELNKFIYFLKISAENNYYPANFSLAVAYFYGHGVLLDLDMALITIEKVLAWDELTDQFDILGGLNPYDLDDHYIFDFLDWDTNRYQTKKFPYFDWSFIDCIRIACLIFSNKTNENDRNLYIDKFFKHSHKTNIYDSIDTESIDQARLYLLPSKEQERFDKMLKLYPDNIVMILLFDYFMNNSNETIQIDMVTPIIDGLVSGKTDVLLYLLLSNDVIFDSLIERYLFSLSNENFITAGVLFYTKGLIQAGKNLDSAPYFDLALQLFNKRLSKNTGPLDIDANMLTKYYIALIYQEQDAIKASHEIEAFFQEIKYHETAPGQLRSENLKKLHVKFLELQNTVNTRLKIQEEERLRKDAQRHAEHAVLLKTRLEKLVQRTSHTLANTIFPNTLYQVAEHIKDKAEHRRDALLLLDAYHAEVSIRHENELLQQRYTTDNPEPLRQILRGDRRSLPDTEARSIEQLLDYALSRVLSR
ncbi:MAG: SEL1-like repeat protein, partial [Gammaproteobacteria bacterium]|nr:SEL1-like repeat protein [Gammaproteobacteria bacterium]